MFLTKLRVVILLCTPLALFQSPAVAQPKLEFAPNAGQQVAQRRVLSLPNGNRLFIGSTRVFSYFDRTTQHSTIALAMLSADGPVYPYYYQPLLGGSGNDVPSDAAIDSAGNVWIVGSTDSDDFNLVNPIVARKMPYRGAAFVIELDPTVTKVLFSSYLAGQLPAPVPNVYYATSGSAIAVDSSGNAYVGGSTNETDFPTTPGAFLTTGGGVSFFQETFVYSFLTKISPAGKLVYSTYLGSGVGQPCFGGSGCIGKASAFATVTGIAVGAGGAATVAETRSFTSGRASRLAADGSKLLWSTQVGGSYGSGMVSGVVMAQDPSGNVTVAGTYLEVAAAPTPIPFTVTNYGLFTTRLATDGSTVIYSTDLGQSNDGSFSGIAMDPSGNAYLAGTSSSPQFPALAGVPNLGPDFVLRLDPAGSKPQRLFRFPLGVVTWPPVFDARGRLLLLDAHGALLSLPADYAFDVPLLVSFANSASWAKDTGMVPGTLVTLFGFDLGASPTPQVSVGGIPAPVLFAGPTQINFVVPFRSPFTQIQLVLPKGTISLVLPSLLSLGIFTTDNSHAAALNHDGSANSAANPAVAGSIVSLFGTGATWPADAKDGVLAPSAQSLDQSINQFSVIDASGTPMNILYAGTAPGAVYGVFQMNVQLTPTVHLPLMVRSGASVISNPVLIYLK